jgi:Ser/Thr protein kinase RdoA (MazF antagonist)
MLPSLRQPLLRCNAPRGLPIQGAGETMAAVKSSASVDPAILAAWKLEPDSVRPLGTGLINRTYLARDGQGTWRVLQQVNPIFPPAVNEDVAAVTAHLAARGVATPLLVPACNGGLCVPAEGGAWRVLTHVPGRVLDALENPTQAREAGRLLAVFHRALADLAHEFRHVRPPVHEPARHLGNLAAAVEAHPGHRLYPAAAALAEEIFAAAAALPPLPVTPARVVHGDPKISNLVFEAHEDRAVCMLDLDTVGRMALPFELGDAFRSWCNVASEDDPRGSFSAELFAAAAAGYGAAAAGWLDAAEAETALNATATIQVELAARFCADILNENYFGWNPATFASRGEHNLARARGQLNVHRSLVAQWGLLEELAGGLSPPLRQLPIANGRGEPPQ